MEKGREDYDDKFIKRTDLVNRVVLFAIGVIGFLLTELYHANIEQLSRVDARTSAIAERVATIEGILFE